MIAFPNAKINIGLQITGKRNDGYHDLQTVFYPVALKDVLEITDNTSSFIFNSSGIVTGAMENICVKAFHLLEKDFSLPPVQIYLHKTIPVGAGLGGGSADAAFCLQLLDKKFNLQLTIKQLSHYALQLGSDCPFFIINKPCLATGRGEQLEEISLDLTGYRILLVNPGIHVKTSWAFSKFSRYNRDRELKKNISNPVTDWKDTIFNDFEGVVFDEHPEIKELKKEIYHCGAIYASMSGSGSSVFGIFSKNSQPILNFPDNYFIDWL